ncbi:MAG: cytochrome P460 family protein [Armatimonadota bacterium]
MRLVLPMVTVLLTAASFGTAALAPVESRSSLVVDYREWTRVNPTPHRVESRIAAECRVASKGEHAREKASPHLDKFVTVYGNPAARKPMLERKRPVFPRGSLLVKEKLSTADSRAPELLTVMRKREKGYFPAGGDWEYLVLDGSGSKIEERGRLKRCASCHAQWKETGFVSRTYLSAAARHRLR